MFLGEHQKEIGTTSHVQESPGLCSTCNNSPGCFFLASRGPALFCEMFDNYVPSALWATGEAAPASVRPLVTVSRADTEVSGCTGLCVNCENRQTCNLPRPDGGVWHCEEYR